MEYYQEKCEILSRKVHDVLCEKTPDNLIDGVRNQLHQYAGFEQPLSRFDDLSEVMTPENNNLLTKALYHGQVCENKFDNLEPDDEMQVLQQFHTPIQRFSQSDLEHIGDDKVESGIMKDPQSLYMKYHRDMCLDAPEGFQARLAQLAANLENEDQSIQDNQASDVKSDREEILTVTRYKEVRERNGTTYTERSEISSKAVESHSRRKERKRTNGRYDTTKVAESSIKTDKFKPKQTQSFLKQQFPSAIGKSLANNRPPANAQEISERAVQAQNIIDDIDPKSDAGAQQLAELDRLRRRLEEEEMSSDQLQDELDRIDRIGKSSTAAQNSNSPRSQNQGQTSQQRRDQGYDLTRPAPSYPPAPRYTSNGYNPGQTFGNPSSENYRGLQNFTTNAGSPPNTNALDTTLSMNQIPDGDYFDQMDAYDQAATIQLHFDSVEDIMNYMERGQDDKVFVVLNFHNKSKRILLQDFIKYIPQNLREELQRELEAQKDDLAMIPEASAINPEEFQRKYVVSDIDKIFKSEDTPQTQTGNGP